MKPGPGSAIFAVGRFSTPGLSHVGQRIRSTESPHARNPWGPPERKTHESRPGLGKLPRSYFNAVNFAFTDSVIGRSGSESRSAPFAPQTVAATELLSRCRSSEPGVTLTK